jgi:hypothetical protein
VCGKQGLISLRLVPRSVVGGRPLSPFHSCVEELLPLLLTQEQTEAKSVNDLPKVS